MEEQPYSDPERMPSFRFLMRSETPVEEEEACVTDEVVHEGLRGAGAPSPRVERIPTVAPMPYLRSGKVVDAFKALKQACIDGAGFDFLGKCADVMRSKDFQTGKVGVATKSFHKTGSAFDYDQSSNRLIVVSEPKGGKQYFRTWLKCQSQDGTQGVKVSLRDIRGYTTNVYSWDFTAAAEKLGWNRIPAWDGWQRSYNKREFWHYQITEGQTFEQLIDYLYKNSSAPPLTPVLQKGDRGDAVKKAQEKLYKLGYFYEQRQVDGNFGPLTETAVRAFQEDNGLTINGKIDPLTLSTLNRLIEEKTKMSTPFNYDTEEVNAAVQAEADENSTPKPWYATSQFAVLLATYILGPVAMYLAAKGVITPDQAPALVGIFQTAVVGGIAFITRQYIAGRNEVTAIKARAAAVRSLGTSSEALSAFRALDRS